MRIRTGAVGLTALVGFSATLVGCGPDADPPTNARTVTSDAPATSTAGTASTSDGTAAAGFEGIAFPPGATVAALGPKQKRYEVKGMTLDQVKAFFEDQLIAAGYVRAQEASASRFYDKGGQRIQVTWSDEQGTIRGVVRVTRG
jgi:hypothetical protein